MAFARERSEAAAGLRRELDRAARRGAGLLTRHTLTASLPHAFERAMPLLLVGPAAVLVFRLILLVARPERVAHDAGLVILVVLAPYVLFVAAAVARAVLARPTRGDSLAVVDEVLDLRGRLAAADEFLRQGRRTPFMDAAIEDAARFVGRAENAALRVPAAPTSMESRSWLWAVGGALVLALALLLPIIEDGDRARVPAGVASHAELETTDRGRTEAPRASVADETPLPPNTDTERSPQGRPTTGSIDRAADLSESAKKAEGRTKSGLATDAGAPSGGTEARGDPTDQGQPAKGNEKPRRPRPSKPKKPAPPAESPRKKVDDRSGATMGRGSSGGSNKNPVASEWTSKDQVPPTDDDATEDDEEVDDETDADDARGGLQPNLRDRRPPASRDLSIGFGNAPGGDGRGGPSERKKSRGTASLVLGVPVPDHVKGQVNPGTTKITQERVEPRAESAESFDAAARRKRALPGAGLLARDLSDGVRAALRAYFMQRRSRGSVGVD